MNKKTISNYNDEITKLEVKKGDLIKSLEEISKELTLNGDNLNEEQMEEKASVISDYEKEIQDIEKSIKESQLLREELRQKRDNMPTTTNVEELTKARVSKSIMDDPKTLEAYVKAMKGDDSEWKKVLSTVETDGTTPGAFSSTIPTVVLDKIERALQDYGSLLAYANITTIKGLLKIAVEQSATGAEFHEENSGAVAEEEIILSDVVIEPKMIKKFITWTDELEKMSAVDLIDYLYGEFLEKIIIKIEEGMLYGDNVTGNKGLQGIYEKTTTDYVTEVDGKGVISYSVLLKLLGSLKGNNIAFFMNRETFYNSVMGLTDSTGNPIFNVLNNNASNVSQSLLGYPVYFVDAIKSDIALDIAETDYTVVAMAKNSYRVNAPDGIRPGYILDRYTKMEEDIVRLRGSVYVGGTPAKIKGIAVLKKGVETTETP